MLPHRLRIRISHCGGEEAIPLQTAIEASPVVVAVASVRETPGDQGPKLLVHGVTWLPLSTPTHASQGAIIGTTILFVFVSVVPTQGNWSVFISREPYPQFIGIGAI